MRVVAWNLRSGTDRKWAALRAMAPDIAVLSEAAREPAALAHPVLGEGELTWEWEGINDTKGVAIAGWDVPLRRRGTMKASGRWAVAAGLGPMLVLGIWSCPRGTDYATEVHRALDAYSSLLGRAGDVIVAGDLNVSPRERAFADVRRAMEARGLVSAYHAANGEAFGLESAMTLHVKRGERERGTHIDYVWLSERLAARLVSAHIGDPSTSDHSPVIVDLAD